MSRFEWFIGISLALGLALATAYAMLMRGHSLLERMFLFVLTIIAVGSLVREAIESRQGPPRA